jgi:hypothetical protein
MRTCAKCKAAMKELSGTMPDGLLYKYHKCSGCGEEIVDMGQLHALAEKYRKQKRYRAKITRWGGSMGARIPSALAKQYRLTDEVIMIPEKEGIRIIPA